MSLRDWAIEHELPVGQDWSVDEVCELIIDSGTPWPTMMQAQEGWHLWTTKMRRIWDIKSLKWRDEPSEHMMVVTATFQDSRTMMIDVPRTTFETDGLRGICELLEKRIGSWRRLDDERLEADLRASDGEFAKQAPDLIDHLIGFRRWHVRGMSLHPTGLGAETWRGGREVRAICGKGLPHRAPGSSDVCECGLYAFHDPALMLARGEIHQDASYVYGAVVARGRIEVHRTGFRAEYARPVLFAYRPPTFPLSAVYPTPTADRDRVTALGKILGVPVVQYSDLQHTAEQHGGSVPKSLLPPPPPRMRRLR